MIVESLISLKNPRRQGEGACEACIRLMYKGDYPGILCVLLPQILPGPVLCQGRAHFPHRLRFGFFSRLKETPRSLCVRRLLQVPGTLIITAFACYVRDYSKVHLLPSRYLFFALRCPMDGKWLCRSGVI